MPLTSDNATTLLHCAMLRPTLIIYICTLSLPVYAGLVQLEKSDDAVTVLVDGSPFAIYQLASEHRRPYFSEVRGADGTIISRPISPPGGDHPHHTGLWAAVDKVNGIEFWHLEEPIENQSVELVQPVGNPAVMKLVNHWLGRDGKPLIEETTTIQIYSNRLLIYDISLKAVDEEVTFGDTEEGFFAFRMAESMREEATGRIVNADGIQTAKGCWGKQSPWVDYFGEVEGKTYGVAIFDDPGNFRPGRYHVRDYGLFTISPFGERDYTQGRLPAQPVVLQPGETLRLRYGMYFHEGDTKAAKVANLYRLFVASGKSKTGNKRGAKKIEYRSSADGTLQPAMFYGPNVTIEVPLLVVLHTWSGDYTQDYHGECERWCVDNGWAYIHPNFRGPNVRPEATGSDLVVQDIADAVRYAQEHAEVDPTRVYLVGTSGGGYTALLMAGRRPELWAGISAWVPVTDLTNWYQQSKTADNDYWKTVEASCGGPPGVFEDVDQQYKLRSPLTHLGRAQGRVALDINAGIRDGHDGSVPVSHTLRAFDEVAVKTDRFTEEEIDYIVGTATVPERLQQEINDPTYGEKKPLLRKESGTARVTLFDGAHEFVPPAALHWLSKQRLAEVPEIAAGLADLPAKGPYFPVDERIIEDRWDLRRFVVPLQRHPANPVLEVEHEWEGTGPNPSTVLRDPDDGLWKMWYTIWNSYNYRNDLPFSYNVCYAESRNGIQWTKPHLNLFDIRGSKQNNCIRLGKFKTQNVDVELLPEGQFSDAKFVAIHNDKGGLHVTTSEDGKSFQYAGQTVVLPYHSDTSNNFVYDEVRNHWLLYVRPQAYAGAEVVFDPPREGLTKVGRRRVAVQQSKDLQEWSSPHTVLVPGENDPEHFYAMCVFRRGDLFFGMLQHYTTKDHTLTYELAWSGDGFHWHRLPNREDAILLGVGKPGAFDDGMIGMSDRPVEVGNELWFYYGGWDDTHEVYERTAAVGIATAERDRLFGVEAAPGAFGRLLTRPLPVSGDLVINAEAPGAIRVSVHAVDDRVLDGWSAEDCTPFRDDQLDAEIKWGDKSLSDLRGQMVRLRFHLDDARLFAFDFRE